MERHSKITPEALITQVNAGHMQYDRVIIEYEEGPIFAKIHNDSMFTDPVHARHSQQYLHKEHSVYEHVARHGFSHIPKNTALYHNTALTMEALKESDGWHWEASPATYHAYLQDALDALSQLEQLPLPQDFHDTLLPTFHTHKSEGWDGLNANAQDELYRKMQSWQNEMHADFHKSAHELIEAIPALARKFQSTDEPEQLYLSHHDFRQANIAWHPDHGVRIVDWSWAGSGRKNSDATTILIDLHKSGFDVISYMPESFSREHALTMIGFWLSHSLWPSRKDSTVRLHQFVSAVSAFRLLNLIEQTETPPSLAQDAASR